MENQLQIIVKESGLEQSKAKYILENFQNYFEIADEWEKKAKTLVVTDESQTAEMQMARTGRLFLREKRIAIEKSRKQLKEQALREGKAIDGIANVLKALIIPIEEYLNRQENFVEIQEEKKRAILRLEAAKKEEEERIAEEKAEEEERKRIRIENERLKVEAVEREKKVEKERKKQAAILAKERAKAEAERKVLEEKVEKEREAAEKARLEAEEKANAERKALEEKARIERERAEAKRKAIEENARKEREKAQAKADKERIEKERLQEMLKNQVECPKCHHKFQLKKG